MAQRSRALLLAMLRHGHRQQFSDLIGGTASVLARTLRDLSTSSAASTSAAMLPSTDRERSSRAGSQLQATAGEWPQAQHVSCPLPSSSGVVNHGGSSDGDGRGGGSAAADCCPLQAGSAHVASRQLTWGLAAAGLQADLSAHALLQQQHRHASSSSGAATDPAANSPKPGAAQRAPYCRPHPDAAAEAAEPATASAGGNIDTAAAPLATWLDRRCPRGLLPYAQLMRLDKPIGERLTMDQVQETADFVHC